MESLWAVSRNPCGSASRRRLGPGHPSEDERACFFLFTLCIPCGLFSITVPYTCISLLAIWQCFSKNWISQPYVLTDSPKVTEWQKRCCMAHGPELRTWAGLEKERKQLIEKCRDSEVMRTGVGLNPRHLPTQTRRVSLRSLLCKWKAWGLLIDPSHPLGLSWFDGHCPGRDERQQ